MKSKTKIYILLVICGILAAASVVMTIETAAKGLEIAKIEKTEDELISVKRDLEGKLVKTLSVSELAVRSGELGFVKSADTIYISEIPAVAKLP